MRDTIKITAENIQELLDKKVALFQQNRASVDHNYTKTDSQGQESLSLTLHLTSVHT